MWHYIQQQLDEPLTAGETDTFFSTNSAISWHFSQEQQELTLTTAEEAEENAPITTRVELLTALVGGVKHNRRKMHLLQQEQSCLP